MKKAIVSVLLTILTLVPILTFLNWIKYEIVYGEEIRSGALFYPFTIHRELWVAISLLVIEAIFITVVYQYMKKRSPPMKWSLLKQCIVSGITGYLGTILSCMFFGGLPFKQFIPLFFTGMLFPIIYRWMQMLLRSGADYKKGAKKNIIS